MGLRRFEDIEAWKTARSLTHALYRLTSQAPFARDFGLNDQIQRASVSIMANIAEGVDSASDQSFIQFLRYALRSATEVQSHLYVALDQGYISADGFDKLYEQTKRIKSLLIGFMRYLSKKDNQ